MSAFNLSALAVRERPVTLFLMLAIFIAGVVAFLTLGRAEDPAFTIKQMTVVTAWPGATAKEMEELVAEPLEKRMQELRWYDRTETFTRPGLAFTTVSPSSSSTTLPSASRGTLGSGTGAHCAEAPAVQASAMSQGAVFVLGTSILPKRAPISCRTRTQRSIEICPDPRSRRSSAPAISGLAVPVSRLTGARAGCRRSR